VHIEATTSNNICSKNDVPARDVRRQVPASIRHDWLWISKSSANEANDIPYIPVADIINGSLTMRTSDDFTIPIRKVSMSTDRWRNDGIGDIYELDWLQNSDSKNRHLQNIISN